MNNPIKSNAELFTFHVVRAVTAPSNEEFTNATMSVVFYSGLISPAEQVRATEEAIRVVQQISAEKRGRALADLEIVLAGRRRALSRSSS